MAFREEIYRRMRTSSGVKISNKGGWQSDSDLFTWNAGLAAPLQAWITKCVLHIHETFYGDLGPQMVRDALAKLNFSLVGWANVNKKGNSNSLHNHFGAHWSGVYYVSAPDNCGSLLFKDPRPHINMLNIGHELVDLFSDTPRSVQPHDGLLVLFPGWLEHWVEPSESDVDRISISFNWRFVKNA